ncbi:MULTISPECIES: hypothetical protein [unclassified Blautia]|mgnify:FL=1|uniref:hypothetical protein n=1 Tax=unclassified Blautia TaxID=2648079 RepID=UPI0025BB9278|nr:hypothetical protein [Blautia sp.]MCI6302287.1 hypothetical protein [Blautia sp.]MDD6415532.1 hypothetical protein [Blautia sp.]MDY4117551.1 hypothetical protein [Blautia sp.]
MDSIEQALFLYEKENIGIVLMGIQLRKKSIDFRAMSDKILTRKEQKKGFSGGLKHEL